MKMTLSCDRDLFAKEIKKAMRQYKRLTDPHEWEGIYIYLSQKTLDWLTGESPKHIKNSDARTTFYGMIIIINDAVPYQTCWISSELFLERKKKNDKG